MTKQHIANRDEMERVLLRPVQLYSQHLMNLFHKHRLHELELPKEHVYFFPHLGSKTPVNIVRFNENDELVFQTDEATYRAIDGLLDYTYLYCLTAEIEEKLDDEQE